MVKSDLCFVLGYNTYKFMFAIRCSPLPSPPLSSPPLPSPPPSPYDFSVVKIATVMALKTWTPKISAQNALSNLYIHQNSGQY